MADHPNWPPADRLCQNICDWLADDLYRQRPHRGGYAMENPPGNIRVELEADDTATRLTVRLKINGASTELYDPSVEELDRFLP